MATQSPIITKSDVRLLDGDGVSVSNLPGNDNVTELGTEAEWENFAGLSHVVGCEDGD